ncbi:DinB family protein [Flagellimonas meridianipacifica]|uniref:DinB family protein n=2 Tax=Flagellimonas meridianipacifica TaxID=1080225 RepID=A0A2T0M9X6_9FLAO|nr:DinB family protein [Allomuricauda pacifica]
MDWIREIDLVSKKFEETFSDFTQEEMNFKPGKKVWSIAQNIEHIILLNSSYFEYFEEIHNRNHSLPKIEDLDTKAQESVIALKPFTGRQRLKRTNTWDIWQPKKGFIDRNILRDFEESQLQFKNHIKGFEDLLLSETFIRYPGHLDLLFKLDDCIEFLIEHENRHWNQVVEIGRHSSTSNGS